MSTKNNPGPNSCYERAEGDEPLFTLLGRDATAPFVVMFWCKMRAIMGESPEQLAEAGQCAESMRDWALKLGKGEKVGLAYEAFKRACYEVTKSELESAIPSEGP